MVKKLRVKLSTSPLQVVQTNDTKRWLWGKKYVREILFPCQGTKSGFWFGSVVSFAPLNFSYLLL